MLTRLRLNQTNRPLEVLQHWRDYGNLLLSPPYQRGDVWGRTRRVNYIRSLLLGIPMASIIVNDRFGADWPDDLSVAVIDGKQRCTTLLMWLDGELSVPREWLSDTASESCAATVCWDDLTLASQRRFQNMPLPFSEGQLPNLAAEQEVFELVNYGGVPQGEQDLD